ncbi:methyltransferase type 11 [Oleiphilus sp. HI0130]|nr:methyltransferase type 11 [Oleiphilus sp. HI0130]KZZ77143.1 methyltransferase type 11 [Oleiphilus sp. HI0130]
MAENTPEKLPDDFELLIDLHKNNERQGPGGRSETELALYLTGLDLNAPYSIADIGCGTGASSLILAEMLNAKVTSVDFLQEFLNELNGIAEEVELDDKITSCCASMDDLPFESEQFDVIWSEGAIYNIGFEQGLKQWRPFLKQGGVLVASEITWTTAERPKELEDYWHAAYPEIDTASNKIKVLERAGYQLLGYFILPEHCWIDNYYGPLERSYDDFLARHNNSEVAQQLIAAEREEVALYRKYKDYYSYGVYVARKL